MMKLVSISIIFLLFTSLVVCFHNCISIKDCNSILDAMATYPHKNTTIYRSVRRIINVNCGRQPTCTMSANCSSFINSYNVHKAEIEEVPIDFRNALYDILENNCYLVFERNQTSSSA
ncbi:expressed protein [Dictyostelium purpureum]|uniref:Expressed protein n=1 Tax=Dictyostelium purpureum TaxID=5786 RepID=F0ZSI6_DICPU|nr:uncharacterized protein DICPUDRAFT_92477 [Dictyostelium purpureum]EGC33098.1 expressed protein [Dictyostelium purpureum]|eukprot:XP_003290375.1 expressed protein [Dictyostelium purpureum]